MRENSGHHQATDSLNHAWAYFELHAKQRIAVFNSFLVLSGFITAGLTAAIQAKGLMLLVGAGLGILLVLVSFIFWKFDQRVSFLIKNAERALIELESSFPEPSARLFSNEVTQTKGATSSGSFFGSPMDIPPFFSRTVSPSGRGRATRIIGLSSSVLRMDRLVLARCSTAGDGLPTSSTGHARHDLDRGQGGTA